ncbi:MAG: hypothetical protein HY434_01245 [Candidatus Liptonbacteria bacterium]|nr:hypothetical protein [Candidatus Liptonbacteria bacterium]
MRFRFGAVFICLACSVAFIVYFVARSNPQYNWDNAKYFEFGGFYPRIHADRSLVVVQREEGFSLPSAEWRLREMKRWQRAVQKAAALLPKTFLEAVGPVEVLFYMDQSIWETAHPERSFTGENFILINLKPSGNEKPEWMTWEPFPYDGFKESEMVWITIHEMKHLYDKTNLGFETWNKAIFEERFFEEGFSTAYGRAMNLLEDSADSFALYVLWPDYLKPLSKHYAGNMKLLGREYAPFMDMPNSVRSKLSTIPPRIASRPMDSSW